MAKEKPSLYTVLSPALLHLYEVKDTIVVVIDVLRATSTIATALFNGARSVVPVDDITKCIALGRTLRALLPANAMERLRKGYSMEIHRSNIPGNSLKTKRSC